MKNFPVLASCIILVLSCLSCKPGDDMQFPGEKWEHISPHAAGFDEELFRDALDYLHAHSLHDGIDELLIVQNGRIVFAGAKVDSVHNIWSCSKTFTSTVLGLLIDDGTLSLDDRAAMFEPLLAVQYPGITFRHFASMTSGYSATGDSRWADTDYADWSLTPYEPDRPYFAPGTAYAYWDEAQMMFGRVLTRVLGESMHDFLDRRIMDPIGMEKWEWVPEGEIEGIPINNGCTNVKISALQFARWGHLFLNMGRWEGRTLLSEEWVRSATTIQVPASLPMGDTDRKSTIGPGCYGFNWWINGRLANGEMKLPGAPEGIYFASGLNNNKCIVIPEYGLVVVRMGQDGHPENKDLVYGTFINMLLESLTDK